MEHLFIQGLNLHFFVKRTDTATNELVYGIIIKLILLMKLIRPLKADTSES
jgi:hypothetical protein